MGKVFNTEEFIIAVFCCVEDWLQEIIQGRKIRQRGFEPKLSDSEVITMEIVGEFRGLDQDKAIWQYFRDHWLCLFPNLGSRSTFARQAANLWSYKQVLQQKISGSLGGFADDLHLVNGIPIPLCRITRAPRCRLFTESAEYGYCAAKDEKYYGFHGHLVISSQGLVSGFTLTGANGSEREALWEITQNISGLLIGDKGYISQELAQQLKVNGIQLQTALRSNMKEHRSQDFLRLLTRFRRLIETVIGQLSTRFKIEKIWARDLWHLTVRLGRKLLAHTVCVWLNRDSLCPLWGTN